ncbi:MAG: ABC transporter permease [Anaerolineae bacterium]|nr:ABC transporter permease [Anaerolineae bacterium]
MNTTTPDFPTQPPSIWGAWLRRNPIVLKELRGRMRGARAFVMLTIYVGLMSLFTVLLYMIYTASSTVTLSTTGSAIGQLIFGGVLAVELFLVCFIAPAFTAGAISGEREHQTYYLLRTTLLSAQRLVFGKLTSAMAYIVLLLFVAVPLQSLAFLMGGVTIAEVLLSVELLVVTAIGYGAVGIFFSTTTRRTLSASILTYVFALLITVVLPLAALVVLSLTSIWMFTASSQPVLEILIFLIFALLACTNPIATAILTEVVLQQHGTAFVFTQTFSNGLNIPLPSPWIVYTLVYGVGTLVLVLLSVRRVRQVDV